MATLDPKLNSGIGFEQPVATPSALGAVGSLVSTFVRATPVPKGPSATELKSAALDPFAQRIFDLKNSNLSDAQFQRTANSMARQAIATNPEYTADYVRITREGYGVAEEVLETPSEDVLTAGRNEYAQSVEGQSDMLRAVTLDDEGYLNDEATQSKFAEYYADSISEKAAIERSSRKLQDSQNNLNQWKTDSELSMNDFVPRWTKKSQDIVDSLITQALSGAEAVDTPEEQLAYLRQAKRALTDEYRAKAQAAGIHPDVYKTQLGEAVAPIENLLVTAMATGEDSELLLNAFTNASRLQAEKELQKLLGPLAGNPAVVQQAMATFGSYLYDKDMFTKAAKGFADDMATGRTTGLNFLPNIPNTPAASAVSGSIVDDTALSDMRRRSSEDKGYVDDTLSSLSVEIKTYKDLTTDYEREGVFRAFGKAVAVSEVSSAPLGNVYLNELLTNNVRTYSTILKGNDEVAVDLKNSLAYFSSKQIRRNQAIIANNLSFMSGYGVELKGNRVVLTFQGVEQPKPTNLSGLGGGLTNLYRSIENINIINSAMSRMGDLEEVTKDVTNGKLMPDSGAEGDIQFYLDSIQGGAGDGPQGSEGTDTLSSSNGPIAQKLGIDFNSYEEANGLPAGYLERTAQIESSGNPNAKNPGSSAGGLFQQLDANAKEWGVRDKFDPVQSTEGAVRFAVSNARSLAKILGREPTGAELYLAHQQGPSGAAKLLNNQSALAVDIVGQKAVTLNGGSPNMTAGEFANIWISKYNGGRGATSMSQATGSQEVPPFASARPLTRPIDLDGSPATSPRPQARPTGGVIGATESPSEASKRAEAGKGSQGAPKAAQERAERVWSKLSNQTKTMLARLFGDEEAVKEALANNELDEEDIPQ